MHVILVLEIKSFPFITPYNMADKKAGMGCCHSNRKLWDGKAVWLLGDE